MKKRAKQKTTFSTSLGHGVTGTEVGMGGQKRRVTASLRRQIKRRSMIDPMIGHMKS
jgi:hypothetical protein